MKTDAKLSNQKKERRILPTQEMSEKKKWKNNSCEMMMS